LLGLGALGAGALGAGAYGINEALRHNWGRNLEDAEMMRYLDALEGSDLPVWQKNLLLRGRLGEQYKRHQLAGQAYRPFGGEGSGSKGSRFGTLPYDHARYYTPWWERGR
jgi:hypothetical protein